MKFSEAYVVDDLLSEEDAIAVSNEVDTKNWQSYWRSRPWHLDRTLSSNWHWHNKLWGDLGNMGPISKEIMSKTPALHHLWLTISPIMLDVFKVSFFPVRAYSNAHTYGIIDDKHTDDGDITVIYYPNQNWDHNWEGGTALYSEDFTDCIRYCSYKFNRLFMFPAKTVHRGMPLTKECTELRRVIVFKCEMDSNHPLYEKMYNAQQ